MAGPDTAPPLSFDAPLGECPHCKSNQLEHFDEDYRGVKIGRCLDCKVKFMNPMVSDLYLQELYANYIDEEEIQEEDPVLSKAHLQVHLDHMQALKSHKAGARFLSIGCGNGMELQAALKHGFEVEGFDVDKDTVDSLRDKFDIPLYHGELLELPLKTESFDVIYMDQVLEHLKEPIPYLKKIHNLLKPGGLLFIAVPNIESFAGKYKTLLGKLGLKQKKRGRHYDTWHHLFYYSPSTLKKVLEIVHGFEVLSSNNDSFILPGLPSWKKGYMNLAIDLPIVWRTTFFSIAKKI